MPVEIERMDARVEVTAPRHPTGANASAEPPRTGNTPEGDRQPALEALLVEELRRLVRTGRL